MNKKACFETERLIFRLWEKKDEKPFIALGQDIEGMQFFSRTYSPEESLAKMYDHIFFIEDNGYGFWAVEHKESGKFIGTIGFNEPSIQSFFTPCIQIGWCLGKDFWGQGLATEGALGALEYIRNNFSIHEIFSYAHKDNKSSLRIMEKIGMIFLGNFIPVGGDPNDSQNHLIAYTIKW